jgi:hypothetical protein
MSDELERLSMEEIEGEEAVSLPDKEVLSLLDVNADVDLGLDLAAPVDLAAAANLNVAAPIEAAASANLLSPDAQAVSVAQQTGGITQGMTGVDANADAVQTAGIDQSADAGEQLPDGGTEQAALLADGTTAPVGEVVDGATGTVGDTVDGTTGTVGDAVDGTTGTVGDAVDGTTDTVGDAVEDTTGGVSSLLSGGSLLEANVNVDADANLTAPIAGGVAANANVAAPIDAAVAANIGSDGAVAQSMAVQDVDIVQTMDDVSADATADQDADVQQ